MFWVDSFATLIGIPLVGLIIDPLRVGTEYIYTWPCRWFRVRFRKIEGSLCQESKIVYLCNHRTWADFFIDRVLTGLHGVYLSRWLVLAGFPIAAGLGYLGNTVKFFYRGTNRENNKKNLYSLLDSYERGIIVYPEGKRNIKNDSLELKTGCIRYAWDRNVSVQVIVSKGKEAILNEFTRTSRTTRDIFVFYGQPIMPSQYNTFDDFLKEIQTSWDHGWKSINSISESSRGIPFCPNEEKRRWNMDIPNSHQTMLRCLRGVAIILMGYFFWK